MLASSPDGTQPVGWWRRGDHNGEIAGTVAVAPLALKEPRIAQIGGNIARWYCFDSIMSQGNPAKPAYGLTTWNELPSYIASDQDGLVLNYAEIHQERAWRLLQLAWLLSLDNTAEVRVRLDSIVADLLAAQDAAGNRDRGWRASA
jgi:hypothetical protein